MAFPKFILNCCRSSASCCRTGGKSPLEWVSGSLSVSFSIAKDSSTNRRPRFLRRVDCAVYCWGAEKPDVYEKRQGSTRSAETRSLYWPCIDMVVFVNKGNYEMNVKIKIWNECWCGVVACVVCEFATVVFAFVCKSCVYGIGWRIKTIVWVMLCNHTLLAVQCISIHHVLP